MILIHAIGKTRYFYHRALGCEVVRRVDGYWCFDCAKGWSA